MNTSIDSNNMDSADEQTSTDGLFIVWFDTNCGYGQPHWWWEDPGPQPLGPALDLASAMRSSGWICIVMPNGMNPRPDGHWDNPA